MLYHRLYLFILLFWKYTFKIKNLNTETIFFSDKMINRWSIKIILRRCIVTSKKKYLWFHRITAMCYSVLFCFPWTYYYKNKVKNFTRKSENVDNFIFPYLIFTRICNFNYGLMKLLYLHIISYKHLDVDG